MSDNHTHSHHPNHQGVLIISLVLTGVFMVAEIMGGLFSGSLALLSDAGHMFNDALSLGLALWALYLGRSKADKRRTYGNRRAETVIAFTNGITLVLISVLIFKEALSRFWIPVTVHSEQMLWISSLGLLVNLVVAGLLMQGASENLNLKGAFLHVLGDLLGSVGAIAAAVIIQFTGWTYADPLVSLLIAFLILQTSWSFLSETWHILMESVPPQIELSELERRILQTEGVMGLHDLHVWSLTGEQILLTAHLQLMDDVSNFGTVASVRQLLNQEFGIQHCTLETEQSLLNICDLNKGCTL
ncbi:MAG: cation diffusion facilitator family transporter [Candidatus Sericytochromatia bacterium]|jgi:cobalt-zinc-cadmium efflux system protein